MNDLETDSTPDEINIILIDGINLNGSWEKKGRNITAAALSGIAGIGVLYFYAQSILDTILVLIFKFGSHAKSPGGFIKDINISSELKVPLLLALTFSQYVFMLLPTLWIIKKWHTGDVIKYVRICRCKANEIALAILITIFVLPFCDYITTLIQQFFRIPEAYRNLGPKLFTAYSAKEFMLLIFVVAITPAICEELLFRGYFQRTMERTIGVKSFIVTGVLFGLFHMQPLGLINLSILGILFSFFYYRSKSIFPSSAAHFTNNLIALLFLYCQAKSINIGFPVDGKFSAVLIFLSLIIAGTFVYIYINITKTQAPIMQMNDEHTNNIE